ncbi:hypothetical protein TKK_0013002 [Trichogramma kaykai]|uniref:snRNA-activating protein complex subunit 1 n=1 Tax=Trichogramma kaykai TaxID=54128 RepID=A0ABD2WKT6_9HYME
MTSSSTDITYTASGFYEDCILLLDSFKNKESIRYDEFCKTWCELKFSLIFLGRRSYADMLEFCEEVLIIAKHFIISSSDLPTQLSGLYLLYSLYYKIPIENIKIRVTYNEWQQFLDLHEEIKDKQLHDASFIFVKLIVDDAYYFCIFSNEYGLERCFIKSYTEYANNNPFSNLNNMINEIENGEFSKIQQLSELYNKNKVRLSNVLSLKKLQLFDKNLVHEVINEVEQLQDKRQEFTGTKNKKKLRDLAFDNKLEKSKYTDDKIRAKLGHGFDTDSSDDENVSLQSVLQETENGRNKNNLDIKNILNDDLSEESDA